MLTEIDAILEDLDSNAKLSLETSAANLPTPRFREGERLTSPMYHKKSLSIINRTTHCKQKGDCFMLYSATCAYVRGSTVWYV